MSAALDGSTSSRAEGAAQWRPSGYSGGDCALLASRQPDPNAPFIIESNPDIAGIGVLLAFLLTAYATLIFTICAYWYGLVPDELLNAVDKNIFGARSERRPGWSEAFREGIRAFSDQQIVTGIAVLASAYAMVNTISVYHWRTVVYLAWMSSTVHLTTITVLRRMLQTNSAARTLRLTGMLVLVVLLALALIPTTSNSFSDAATNIPYQKKWPTGTRHAFTPADPVHCFWNPTYMNGIAKDAVFSYLFLAGSYIWKILSLYGSSHRIAKKILRDWPAQAVPRLIKKAALWRSSKHPVVFWATAWPYSLMIGLYVLYIAVFDFLNSFAASMYILLLSLVWGTINLVIPRLYLRRNLEGDEDEWNFGQYLPLLLLLLPVMSVVEEFSVRKDKVERTLHHTRIPTVSSTTGSDTFELLGQQRSCSTGPPSRADTQATTTSSGGTPSSARYYPSAFDTPPGGAHIRNRSREIYITNLDRAPTTHNNINNNNNNSSSTTTTTKTFPITHIEEAMERVPTGLERWQDGGLYVSRFFRSLVWLAVVSIFLAAAYVFFGLVSGLINGYINDWVTVSIGYSLAVACVVMISWVALGSLCSRVSLRYS